MTLTSNRIAVERVHYSIDTYGETAERCDDKHCAKDHVFGLYEYTGQFAEWIADFKTKKIADRAAERWQHGDATYVIVHRAEAHA